MSTEHLLPLLVELGETHPLLREEHAWVEDRQGYFHAHRKGSRILGVCFDSWGNQGEKIQTFTLAEIPLERHCPECWRRLVHLSGDHVYGHTLRTVALGLHQKERAVQMNALAQDSRQGERLSTRELVRVWQEGNLLLHRAELHQKWKQVSSPEKEFLQNVLDADRDNTQSLQDALTHPAHQAELLTWIQRENSHLWDNAGDGQEQSFLVVWNRSLEHHWEQSHPLVAHLILAWNGGERGGKAYVLVPGSLERYLQQAARERRNQSPTEHCQSVPVISTEHAELTLGLWDPSGGPLSLERASEIARRV